MFLILSLFLFHFLIYISFFRLVAERYPNISQTAFDNLLSDLERIGFPYDISFSLTFYAVLTSIIQTLVITTFSKQILKKLNILDISKNYLKVLFYNFASLTIGLYLLRFFELSRALIVIFILFYPLIYFIFLGLQSLITNKFNLIGKYVAPVALIILIAVTSLSTDQTQTSYSSADSDVQDELNDNLTNQILETNEEILGNSFCYKWSGSENFKECVKGTEVISLKKVSQTLNNIIVFKDKIFVIDPSGIIYDFEDNSILLDINEKVLDRVEWNDGEAGLWSMAFHPNENYFLISYSNTLNQLIVEKYSFEPSFDIDKDNFETLLVVPSSVGHHYGGNIIWSEHFNDFLISVGDMIPNSSTQFDSEPLDTTSIRGKIIMLNNRISKPDLIAHSPNYEARKDIVVYGLRNPWKTKEHNGLLFVADVGHNFHEELTVLDLNQFSESKEPFLLGWPYFEGAIDKEIKYDQVLLWNNSIGENIEKYVFEKSIPPNLYYDHQAPENFRAAIIGGDVISDTTSKYQNTYFFADWLTAEVFGYNYLENTLTLYPLPETFTTSISSLIVNPYKKDSLMAATGDGRIVEINLP